MTATNQWHEIQLFEEQEGIADLWLVTLDYPEGFRVTDCIWSSDRSTFVAYSHESDSFEPVEYLHKAMISHFMLIGPPTLSREYFPT